ncbi:sensor histidine kinase [Chromobacterium sp. Panama]|uniref:sensor histidine kinase n=1 Tax=Chromobacterium sp. Panama TaxID=2161826 RepID=UPI0013048808|nr:sensor histidine kinase [Chromobacterium sp. Panama]
MTRALSTLLLLCLLLAGGVAHAGFRTFSERDAAVYCSADADLDIDRVASAGWQTRFQPLPDGKLARGYGHDTCWLRLKLSDVPPRPWLELIPSYLARLSLYQRLPDGGWQRRDIGSWRPVSAMELPLIAASFSLLPHEQTVFVKVQSLALNAQPRLWSEAELAAHNNQRLLQLGLIYGYMLTMVLIALAAWLITRRAQHAKLFGYILAVACHRFATDGMARLLLFPEQPQIALLCNYVGLGAAVMLGCAYFAHLLELKRDYPRTYRLYQLQAAAGAATVLCALFWPFGLAYSIPVTLYAIIVINLLTLPVCWRLWRRNDSGDRLIALHLPTNLALNIPALLLHLGHIPYQSWIQEYGRLADLPPITLLYIGLFLRMRTLERERIEALHQASQAQADSLRQREAREEQADLLAMITHEIRTPVAIIDAASSSLRLLEEDAPAPPVLAQRQARHERIQRALQRMQELMRLAEQHGRADVSDAGLHSRPLDLLELTRRSLEQLDADAQRRFWLQSGGARMPLCGDDQLLTMLLQNLMENALKYAHPDTPIQIGVHRLADRIVWQISDYGPGIAPGQEEAIFQRFTRLAETSNRPGLGLGLHLARRIAVQHGGELGLDPHWPHGASFILHLPKAAHDAHSLA